MSARKNVLHPYARISHPDQRKGGGLERQTAADVGAFAERFGFQVSKRILVDDGVSAWKGLNATPKHQLGQFLADAAKGLIPAGDCLLLENYDRLSRQDPWAAIGLINELRQLKIHVGRLDRMKLLRYDSTDAGDFFDAAVEFMRGNSESNIKSERNGKAWARKRDAARKHGAVITRRLPAWLEEHDGKLRVLPGAKHAIIRVYQLAAAGRGNARIVKQLTEEGIPPFGCSGHWTRAYIGLLLFDERVLGRFQPRRLDGTPDGEPIKDYYPPAITLEQWHAARVARTGRKPKGIGSRSGKHIDLFAGLLRDARGGGGYYSTTRTDHGRYARVLLNTEGAEGRAKCYSFPLPPFEQAIRDRLKEIDAHEILNGDRGPDETIVLAGELARVEEKIGELEAELLKGEVATIAKVLRQLEGQKRDLSQKLADARQKAAHPLSEAWGQAQSLVGILNDDARQRLRAALRRILDSIWLLVVPRGRDRLCAVQIWFADGKRRRDYLIFHRPPKANASARQEGTDWVSPPKDLPTIAKAGELDLRKPEDARKYERYLLTLPLP
jgi:DNA invertase Pin-like site-specific DNA recombinase